MDIFDAPDPKRLNSRETQLWILAIVVLAVLAVGIAVLMYPAVFSTPAAPREATLKIVFFAFCALSVLMVSYLVDRQLVIQTLRRRLAEEQTHSSTLISQTSAYLLDSLPGLSHFQDRLAMEFRRSLNTDQPLSVVAVALNLSRNVLAPGEIISAFGDAAKALMRRLRGEDSLFFFRTGAFAVVLPHSSGHHAHQLADRIAEGLVDASGASDRFTFGVNTINYPDDVSSASELERRVRATSEEWFRGFVPSEEPLTTITAKDRAGGASLPTPIHLWQSPAARSASDLHSSRRTPLESDGGEAHHGSTTG